MCDKRSIRLEVKQRQRELSLCHAQEMATKIFAQLEAMPQFRNAHRILLYHSLPDEVETHRFIEKWCIEKQILLPVVVGDDLELRHYTPTLTTGAYGIQEPTGEPAIEQEVELVVVPAVAFDLHCNRLGRGKGFYDRLLSRLHAYTVGVAYDFQLYPQLPVEPHDVPLDVVILPNNSPIYK